MSKLFCLKILCLCEKFQKTPALYNEIFDSNCAYLISLVATICECDTRKEKSLPCLSWCRHGSFVISIYSTKLQTADVLSRRHLRSASQLKMIVPRYRMDSYDRRCFAVAARRPGIRCQTVFETETQL